MLIAKIHVTLKPSVLDPQGVAVSQALRGMGFGEVEGLRLGKYMELKLAEKKGQSRAAVEKRVKLMCQKLLSNTVIERFEIKIEKAGAQR